MVAEWDGRTAEEPVEERDGRTDPEAAARAWEDLEEIYAFERRERERQSDRGRGRG